MIILCSTEVDKMIVKSYMLLRDDVTEQRDRRALSQIKHIATKLAERIRGDSLKSTAIVAERELHGSTCIREEEEDYIPKFIQSISI